MGTLGAWAAVWMHPVATTATIQASFFLNAACIGAL
jgi:hypothetical protein